jgi:hypothetical protein
MPATDADRTLNTQGGQAAPEASEGHPPRASRRPVCLVGPVHGRMRG